MRELRLRFNPEAPLNESEVTQLIQTASLGLDLGQAEALSLMIRRALNRRKDLTADQLSPASLDVLGDTQRERLKQFELSEFASVALFKRAHPESLSTTVLALLRELGLQWSERGDKRYSAKELQTFWATYLATLRRFGQVKHPSCAIASRSTYTFSVS